MRLRNFKEGRCAGSLLSLSFGSGLNRRGFLAVTGTSLALIVGNRRQAQGASAARKPMRDIIVLLPGLMGSVLQKHGKDVWALSGKAIVSGLRSLNENISALSLKDDPPNVSDIGDGITAPRIFPGTHLIPGLWKIDGYSKISRSIQENFEVTLGQNFFEFPYDWRRDIRVAARRLASMSGDWLTSWQRRPGNRQARLVFVAHSMGGLVARYFMECLDGWRVTRRLVTLGTPFRGSLNALDTLANGISLGSVPLTGLSTMARSFTSIYQLLPRYPCYEPGNGTLVRVGETSGIPNVDARKAARALDFYREIDACVQRNQKDTAYVNDLKIHPIVGSYQPTLQSARLAGTRVQMLTTYPNQDWDGDGTVPEVSAVPVEMSDTNQEMYVSQLHGSLQNTPTVLDQVMKVLSKSSWESVRRAEMLAGPPRISLHVVDSYVAGQPVKIRASCSKEGTVLNARISDAVTNRDVARRTIQPNSEGLYEANLAPLPEGLYRIAVGSQNVDVAATDVFLVAGP